MNWKTTAIGTAAYTLVLLLQFGIFGVLIGLIFRSETRTAQ